MTAQSSMFDLATSGDMGVVTSSPGSADGPTPCDSPALLKKPGPAPAPANPSAWQEVEKARLTNGTFGPLFDGLSKSASLQSSLESRLRERLDVHGSLEYVLTWKHEAMPLEPRISVLRASARPTSGKGSTGWPTPRAIEPGARLRSLL